MTPAAAKFFDEILVERGRQDRLFPLSIRQSRPHLNRWDRLSHYTRLLAEELGEVCDAIEKSEATVCTGCRGTGWSESKAFAGCSGCGGDGRTQATKALSDVREELIQVAALCLRTIEEEDL